MVRAMCTSSQSTTLETDKRKNIMTDKDNTWNIVTKYIVK